VKIVDEPRQVAVIRDPNTLYCKHRTVFFERLDDLQQWLQLAKHDAVSFEDLTEKHLPQYKLILPNILDEVMSAQNIDLIERSVRGGARMVMTANTGKYCPELGTAPFQLLKRLGITPPTGRYINNTTGTTATVLAANPLFATGATVKFFTFADYRQELQTPREWLAFMQWPYRWLPQTDYFGYYGENTATNGEVLARFPSGAVALSRHQVGKGDVLVFWGTPDYKPELLKGMMARAAEWAGVIDPRQGSPIPYMLEGHSDELNRHYALFYQDTPGAYTVRLPHVPDGLWFLDDMVSTQRIGLYTGKELREKGLQLTYADGYSPLKIIRMMPKEQILADWATKYRNPAE
jgi:hypothetical protein